MFGRRAALAALDDPEPTDGGTITADVSAPSRETRTNVWLLAGLERTQGSLERLQHDPYPLARLVAASALHRHETRGAHGRAEYPDTDPALDAHHTIIDPDTEIPRFEAWADR